MGVYCKGKYYLQELIFSKFFFAHRGKKMLVFVLNFQLSGCGLACCDVQLLKG